MSKVIQDLQKQSADLDQKIDKAKKSCNESENTVFAKASAFKKLDKVKSIKSEAIQGIQQVAGVDSINDAQAPQILAKVFKHYSQELEEITQASGQAEQEFKMQRKQYRIVAQNVSDYQTVSNSKKYIQYYKKKLRHLKLQFESDMEEIYAYIARMRRHAQRKLKKVTQVNEETKAAYQEAIKKIMNSRKTLKITLPQQSATKLIASIDSFPVNLQKKIEEQQIAEKVQIIQEKLKQQIQTIHDQKEKEIQLYQNNLLKSFLIKLYFNRKLNDLSNNFSDTLKTEKLELQTTEYDLEIMKVKEEVALIKKQREEEKIKRKEEDDALDKDVNELEHFLSTN